MRRSNFHDYALFLAELYNPGGKHVVTEVEINGKPDPDNPEAPYADVQIKVATRVSPRADVVDIRLVSVPLPPTGAPEAQEDDDDLA